MRSVARRRRQSKTGWGGARPGAGRKPGPNPATPHRARPEHDPAHPVLVTLTTSAVPLRSQRVFPTVRDAIAKAARHLGEHFRIVHFSVDAKHVHLLVEATNRRWLSSGISGLAIRTAHAVNALLGRSGKFWSDRVRGRELTTAQEVRDALVFVLQNFRLHTPGSLPVGIDGCSSAPWFDGFEGQRPESAPLPTAAGIPVDESVEAPVLPARTALLAREWRALGLVGPAEAPRPPRRPPGKGRP
jgi:putative transposase